MIGKIVLLAYVITITVCDRDDAWVWNENGRNSHRRSSVPSQSPTSRYNVYEETDNDRPGSNYFPNSQNTPINQRPPPINQPFENGYQQNGPAFGSSPAERPGGVYTSVQRPTYASNYNPEGDNPGILTGPVPSWVKEGPIKDFDRCKCTEKFNCNTPGFSYGHCDTGKQYCCYSSRKQKSGPSPNHHSIENGILVGPGGPSDNISGVIAPRPPQQSTSGFIRPGGYQGFGGNSYGQHNFNGVRKEQNEYSPANGILVGPGGPTNSYSLARSAKKSD